MKALAQWAMTSRRQAIIAMLLCFAVPLMSWFGAALLALVILRQGWKEGASVVLWGILPCFAWYAAGDPTPLITAIGTLASALILRSSVRLERALMLGSLLGIGLYVLLPLLLPGVVEIITEGVHSMIQEGFSGQPEVLTKLEPILSPMIVGVLAALHVLGFQLALLLGRYWQSELYNPKGFGLEFKALRLPMFYSLPSVLLLLGLAGITPDLAGMVPVLTVPMVLAGVALFHAVVTMKKAGTHWLVLLYAAMFMFGPYTYTLLIFIALLDSSINFRTRLKDTA